MFYPYQARFPDLGKQLGNSTVLKTRANIAYSYIILPHPLHHLQYLPNPLLPSHLPGNVFNLLGNALLVSVSLSVTVLCRPHINTSSSLPFSISPFHLQSFSHIEDLHDITSSLVSCCTIHSLRSGTALLQHIYTLSSYLLILSRFLHSTTIFSRARN
jgi:hypothetical protein